MNGDCAQLISDTTDDLSTIKDFIDSNKLNPLNRHLICFAVVKSSGTIEYIYKNIIFDALSEGANLNSIQFLEAIIMGSSSNPNTGNMQRLLESINKEWSASFIQQIKGIQEKADLNSLVDLRNTFSHGSSISISIENVQRYFVSGCQVLAILDGIVSQSQSE